MGAGKARPHRDPGLRPRSLVPEASDLAEPDGPACVRVIVECDCGARTTWAVPVRTEVPSALRCSPGDGASMNETVVHCDRCGKPTSLTLGALRDTVERDLETDYARWAEFGAVTVRAYEEGGSGD